MRTPRPPPAGAGRPTCQPHHRRSPSVEVYPLRSGGRAVPDRTREPDIGAACHETRKVVPAPSFTDENRSGVELGTPSENPKTAQEYGDIVRESRGVRTRPERPGQHG
jgi:hypothetical protein